jgi:aspartate-semialdehyde dehydrogenase
MTRKLNVAVVGATGAVGQEMIRQLEDRQFPVERLLPLASARSAGSYITFHGEQILVEEATPDRFEGIDIALFSAGGKVSKLLAPEAVKRGAVVIDNTSAFRMEEGVPLVVPEVNREAIFTHKGIIANPNCSTIQMTVALKPIRDRYGLKRVIVSTYQAVSGAGASAMQETLRQTRAIIEGDSFEPAILPVGSLPVKHQIAFNAIPQIDVFEENGYTYEEMKMVRETKKIFADPAIEVSATCVRIPVLTGHSESVYVETNEEIDHLEEVFELLSSAPGVVVVDDPSQQKYPMAVDAVGKREVFVGRIRRDLDRKNGIHMWIVSDNLLKGAAWNSVQIAEHLIQSE